METHLMHWGIKGMKWGIRRYQNEDGSLTPEGKKRYKKSDGSLTKAGIKQEKKFLNKVNSGWRKTFNKASEKHNKEIERINKKYEGKHIDKEYSTKDGKKYITEISNSWDKIYKEQLISDFGQSIMYGKDWVDNYYVPGSILAVIDN